MTDWTPERRERLEAAPLHVKGCPLAHAPNRFASCACGLDIFAALSEIDRLTARVEALEGALREARAALHQHYVDWDGEPEDAAPLQLARAKCDAALRGDHP